MRGQNYVQPLTAAEDESSEVSPLTPTRSTSFGNTVSTSADPVSEESNGLHQRPTRSPSASDHEGAESEHLPHDKQDATPDAVVLPGTYAPAGDSDANRNNDSSDAVPRVKSLPLVTISEALETRRERTVRKNSHIVIYITCFIMSMGFSIVLTSVWPYLKQLDSSSSKVFYGFVIAINPLGQLLAAPILGWWGNKMGSNRLAFLVSIFCYVLGNVMYAFLRLVDTSIVAYALMLSRFIVGIGSANIAVCRSYLSASTMIKERSTAMGYASAAQSIGLILGPAIQTALAWAIPEDQYPPYEMSRNGSLTDTGLQQSSPVWDLYTAAGWIAALLGLINMLLFVPLCYKEVNISLREAQMERQREKNTSEKYPKPDFWATFVLLLNFFLILFVYVLLETIIVPMSKDLYAWSSEFAIKTVGIGLSVIGILAFFMFFACTLLTNRFDERKIYIFLGLLPLIFAMMIHFPVGPNYAVMQNCTRADDAIGNTTHYPTDTTLLGPDTTSSFQASPVTSSPEFLTRLRRDTPVHYQEGSYVDPLLIPNSQDAAHPYRSQRSKLGAILSAYANVVSRSKRAVILESDDGCDALGCPTSQTWCLYTPIIEIPQLIVGNVFGVIGYPVAFTLSSSLFSKVIGPANQGFWMGLLTSTGSASRMAGPIFVTWVYSEYGTRWTFGALTFALILTFILACVSFKRLVPMCVTNKQQDESQNVDVQ